MPPKGKQKDNKKKKDNKDKQNKDSDDEEDRPQNCKKVEDPCKICLQTVTSNDGIKCMGACEAWVHFECLDYTPGRIKDIQEGVIKVTCPCPDCKTTAPKEYRTDKPFTCNNVHCPANNPPSCEEPKCQANEMNQAKPQRCPPPGTLRSCGASCKEYTGSLAMKTGSSDRCFRGGETCETGSDPLNRGTSATCPIPRPPPGRGGGGMQPTAEVMKQMCKTVGDLAQQLNCLMDKVKVMNAKAAGGVNMSTSNSCSTTCSNSSSFHRQNNRTCTGKCGKTSQTKCTTPCRCPGNPVHRR